MIYSYIILFIFCCVLIYTANVLTSERKIPIVTKLSENNFTLLDVFIEKQITFYINKTILYKIQLSNDTQTDFNEMINELTHMTAINIYLSLSDIYKRNLLQYYTEKSLMEYITDRVYAQISSALLNAVKSKIK